MAPKIETANVQEPSVEQDVEATLREVRAFLEDPVALLERALSLLTRRGASEPPALSTP